MEYRTVYYRGTVQGVGFRYTTQRIASGFAVTGYVQNLPDGRVLIRVQGSSEQLDRFLAAVMERLGHYVADVEVLSEPSENRFCGFEIRF